MSAGGRSQVRQRVLRRAGLTGAILVLLTLLLLVSGHWVLGIVFAAAAVVAVWVFLQARTVH